MRSNAMPSIYNMRVSTVKARDWPGGLGKAQHSNGRTVPVVHQEAGSRRDTNTECQCEFLDVTFDESLTDNFKIGNAQVIKYLPPCI